MVSRQPFRRIHYLVDKKMQLTYARTLIFYVAFIAFILSGAIWFLNREYLDLFHRIVGENAIPQAYIQSIQNQLILKLGLAIITIVVLLYGLGIYVSNRFAGPLYRLTKYLNLAGIENNFGTVKIRKHDQLHELAQAFNNMVSSFETKLNEDLKSIDLLREKISEILKAIEKGSESPAELFEKIKDIDELTSKLAAASRKK